MDDVLVIGAGYTGLAAAYYLRKKNLKITLLEGRERVGGRTLDCLISGNKRLELGGQYITPSQKRVTELVADLGLKTYQAWSKGNNFLFINDKVSQFQTSPAQCLAEHLNQPNVQQEIESALKQLESLYSEVTEASPWKSPKAKDWDSFTFQSWIDCNIKSSAAKQFFRFMTNQGFSTEPEQISFLQMLWFFKTSHGLPSWALGGAQANRVDGGTQLVAERLALKLEGIIKYDEKVISIEQNDDEVQVITENNAFRAKRVIVCIPPQLINAVQYYPPLPSDLFRAFSAFQVGNSMKVQAVYKKPFWRDRGFSGNGISFNGVPTFTYDNTSPAGKPGVLLGFLSATNATVWNDKPKEERISAVLRTWATVFGQDALYPKEYIEMDWMRESLTRGGHGAHFPPGVWAELGPALGGDSMPHFGRVIWAASDLAKDWNGYLEGALFAGEQAAQEVVEELSLQLTPN